LWSEGKQQYQGVGVFELALDEKRKINKLGGSNEGGFLFGGKRVKKEGGEGRGRNHKKITISTESPVCNGEKLGKSRNGGFRGSLPDLCGTDKGVSGGGGERRKNDIKRKKQVRGIWESQGPQTKAGKRNQTRVGWEPF